MSEKEIIDLAHAGVLPHLKVAGEFLRFRREDIVRVKTNVHKRYNLPEKKPQGKESLKEFFYFNDFYIVSTIVILVLLWIIFKDFLL
jgi:hypothetical protein